MRKPTSTQTVDQAYVTAHINKVVQANKIKAMMDREYAAQGR